MKDELEKQFESLQILFGIVGLFVGAASGWIFTSALAQITLFGSRIGGFASYEITFLVLVAIVGYNIKNNKWGTIIGAIVGLVWASVWSIAILYWTRTAGFLVLGGTGILLIAIVGVIIAVWIASGIRDSIVKILLTVVTAAVMQANENMDLTIKKFAEANNLIVEEKTT